MGLENPLHIAVLLLIILLVFGAKRLPEMGRSLGEGMRGFKDSISGGSDEHAERLPAAQPEQPPVVPAPPPAQPPAASEPGGGPVANPPQSPAASEQLPANK